MKTIRLFVILIAFSLQAQEEDERVVKEKYPTSFAFQFSGLLNNKFIESSPISLLNDTVISSIGMNYGFSFGGIIRRQFTDALGIEIGLKHNKRFFNVSGTVLDTNVTYKTDFAFTNYELPVMGLVFIQFSKEVFASAGLGFTAIYKPSSVYVQVNDVPVKRSFSFEGYAYQKFGFNANAQFGFEWRSERSGIFYIGGAASIPTSPLFSFVSVYRSPNEGVRVQQGEFVRSPFFSIDLRYYFPKVKNKGVQPNKGPIE